jgi:acetyl-CoA carboxylase biotin carboxyl carrier protein
MEKTMNSLEEYGALFQKLGLSEMVVEDGDFKLKLRKDTAKHEKVGDSPEKQQVEESESGAAPKTVDKKSEDNPDGEPIKAPLLGIFYAANGDNKAVKEGDTVKEGDVLCTIEAMKMMNEVRSTKSGVVKKVCAKEGDLVEYNQTLFVVKAS